MEKAQDRACCHLDAQQIGEALSCSSPLFSTRLTRNVAESEGGATVRRGDARKSLSEETLRTGRLIAGKRADVEMENDLPGLHRQILDRAGVPAVDSVSSRSTDGTRSSPRDAFTPKDQTRFLLPK
jgi:hypothetical protein